MKIFDYKNSLLFHVITESDFCRLLSESSVILDHMCLSYSLSNDKLLVKITMFGSEIDEELFYKEVDIDVTDLRSKYGFPNVENKIIDTVLYLFDKSTDKNMKFCLLDGKLLKK